MLKTQEINKNYGARLTHLNRRRSFHREVVMMLFVPAKFKGMQVACPKNRLIYHVRLPHTIFTQSVLRPVCSASNAVIQQHSLSTPVICNLT